jgi:hypothetical protein
MKWSSLKGPHHGSKEKRVFPLFGMSAMSTRTEAYRPLSGMAPTVVEVSAHPEVSKLAFILGDVT